MNDLKPLPAYTKEELAKLSTVELINLIIKDADRVPRKAIDECARRGEEMAAHLRQLYDANLLWLPEAEEGDWWLRLHAVMILGLIPGEHAGQLLVDLMHRMSEDEDENLQDWLSGYWTALFENKPESAVSALRDIAADGKLDWYIRVNAIDPVIVSADRQNDAALEQALAWLAEMAADEMGDWDFRLSAAGKILHYPCAAHKPLLENLASRQSGWGRHFDMDEVRRACAGQYHEPEWKRFKNPWEFYEPNAIAQRQKRWHEEDMRASQRSLAGDSDDFYEDDFSDFDFAEPYIRPESKIGRNDPCPCGSGKKYKKCCLVNE